MSSKRRTTLTNVVVGTLRVRAELILTCPWVVGEWRIAGVSVDALSAFEGGVYINLVFIYWVDR